MYFSTLITLAVTGLGVAQAHYHCLSSYDANTLATNFGLLISAYSEKLANQTLTPGYTDYSESVNTLIDSGTTGPVPLLSATFSSRSGFESASAAQPPVPFTVKNVWNTCDVITVRWESDQTPQPVVGISVLHTTYTGNWRNPSKFSIDEVWAEFDSGAWLVNVGCKIDSCPAPPSKLKREISFEG